ncbi:Rcf2p Ecym_2104 [Eremothecium cymbalariae DBVPG|uniref:HIG1 domain-containing protein n=1 Tax=Eremothecium cymbalariae (strain CBS 270.75 / DBVPG 7215 / KCTC 17166 / NRRL Y-17582) TaxID=931890 RepID=G8JPK8_ERECY|nr:Hypothetical protein Ecym_2104 [Eremothecium cymbalariae DBVPG\
MKLLTEEEVNAHHYHTLAGGIKGALAGLAITGVIFKVLPRRFPKFQPSKMTASIRTALFISPPTLLATIVAEEASTSFDRQMYASSTSAEALEEYRRWQNLPLNQMVLESLMTHRYKIIVTAWATSLYGAWKYVNKDPIMTAAQKAVQARMYAQALTVMLLLGSVGLSMYDAKLHPDARQLERARRWEKALERAEEQEMQAAAGKRSNEDRIKGKIFRYD